MARKVRRGDRVSGSRRDSFRTMRRLGRCVGSGAGLFNNVGLSQELSAGLCAAYFERSCSSHLSSRSRDRNKAYFDLKQVKEQESAIQKGVWYRRSLTVNLGALMRLLVPVLAAGISGSLSCVAASAAAPTISTASGASGQYSFTLVSSPSSIEAAFLKAIAPSEKKFGKADVKFVEELEVVKPVATMRGYAKTFLNASLFYQTAAFIAAD